MRLGPTPLRWSAAALAVAAVLLAACEKPQEETAELPPGDQAPAIEVLEFTSLEDAFPPQVAGATDVRLVPWEEDPALLSADREAVLLDSLLADAEVAAALGESFTHVTTDLAEADKETGSAGFRAEFFSYSNNATVRVGIAGEKRSEIERIDPAVYQPPASSEEYAAAIELAGRALADQDYPLEGLEPAAILAFPGDGTVGEVRFYPSRVLYVSYSSGEFEPPRYFALVDLTSGEVLDSGRAAGSAN